jgi:hypothetical protein
MLKGSFLYSSVAYLSYDYNEPPENIEFKRIEEVK